MVKMLVYSSGRDIKHLLWLTSGNLHFISTWSSFFIASKISNISDFCLEESEGGLAFFEVVNIKKKKIVYSYCITRPSQNTACHNDTDLFAGEFLLPCFEGFLRFVGEFQLLCFAL